MKKVLIIGPEPKGEVDINKYNSLVKICVDFDCEVISSPINSIQGEAFSDYSDIFNDIADADMIIADVSEESILLGMQLREVDHLNKPLIVIVKAGKTASHILDGIPTIAEILEYEEIEDITDGIQRNFTVIE